MEFLKRKLGKSLLLLMISSSNNIISAQIQNFEGVVTYQYKLLNPNKSLISDEEFYNEVPNKGISYYKMYIKQDQYRIDYPNRIEVYQPLAQKVVIYPIEKNQDSFYIVSTATIEDKVDSIISPNTTISVLGNVCKSLKINTKWATKWVYFNKDILKTSVLYWKKHLKDQLCDIMSVSAAFPLKIIINGSFENSEITAVKIEAKPIDKLIFKQIKGEIIVDSMPIDSIPTPSALQE